MNEYRIQSMKLLNFCGIQSLEIQPDGADLSIFGDNATGKTTIANAFAWLFTGKNAAAPQISTPHRWTAPTQRYITLKPLLR